MRRHLLLLPEYLVATIAALKISERAKVVVSWFLPLKSISTQLKLKRVFMPLQQIRDPGVSPLSHRLNFLPSVFQGLGEPAFEKLC